MLTHLFEVVAGFASVAGLVISVFTLAAAKSTKRQLDTYKFQVDVEDQLHELNGIKDALFRDGLNWSSSSVRTCQMAAQRVESLYEGKISHELSSALHDFIGKLIEWKRTPQNATFDEDLKDQLLIITIKIEKELSAHARSAR